MNPFLFLRGEFRRSWGGALALALVLAFAGSLSPAVSMMERAIRSGMAESADAFDLLVGARGSAVDLVLGAVYLRPEALSLLPEGMLEEVKSHGGIRWAAPLAFGDRWRDFPLAGTSSELVNLGGRRPLASGRMFLNTDEAVVGAGVPLKEGDSFAPSHGSVAEAALDEDGSSRAHEHMFRVVGKMPATGTPWDRAIVVPIEALWNMHGAGTGRSSVVVVKPVTVADAYRLRAAFNARDTQAVFSGEVLTRLFSTLEDMHNVMLMLTSAAQAAALAAAQPDSVGTGTEAAATEPARKPEIITVAPGSRIPDSPSVLEEPRRYEGSRSEFSFSLTRQLYSQNGVAFVYSIEGESYQSIAKLYNLFPREILYFNDVTSDRELLPGTVVYLQPKKKKAAQHLDKYIAEGGETLWDISQRFAVKLHSIMKKNGFSGDHVLVNGDTVVLR